MSAALGPLAVAFALGVMLVLLDAFGCACSLETHPEFSIKQHGPVITVPIDPTRPLGRPAPRNDEDGGI